MGGVGRSTVPYKFLTQCISRKKWKEYLGFSGFDIVGLTTVSQAFTVQLISETSYCKL